MCRWLSLVLSLVAGMGFSTPTMAYDRSALLFYASLDRSTTAQYARGNPAAQPGYHPRFAQGISGQGAVVGGDTGFIDSPGDKIPFWLDIDIAREYGPELIGALRWEAGGNIRAEEGTFSFWAQPVDWKSGGKDHYLAHIDMTHALNFVWAPYYGVVAYHRTQKSDRDTYRQLRDYVGLNPERARCFTVSWREPEMDFWIDGRRVDPGVGDGLQAPEQGKVGAFFALGAAGDYHTTFSDVMILGKKVTDTEAEALYLRGKTGGSAPLVIAPRLPAAPPSAGGGSTLEKHPLATIRGWSDKLLRISNADPCEAGIGYDAQAIHFTFAYPVPQKFRDDRATYVGSPVRMVAERQDDPALLADDHFAVVLSPDNGKTIWFFAANAKSLKYDSRNGEVAANPAWQCQTRLTDDLWTMTFSIPFASLGIDTPSAGQALAFNLYHKSIQVEDQDSAWVVGGRTNQPLGTLILGGSPRIVVEDLENPASGTVAVRILAQGLEGKKLKVRAEVFTSSLLEIDPTDKVLAPRDSRQPGKAEENAFGPDGQAAIKFVLDKPVAADLLLSVFDEEGVFYFRQRMPFAFTVEATAELNYLPSTDQLVVGLDAGSEAMVKNGLAARVQVLDSKAEVRLEGAVPGFSRIAEELRFDTANLAIGHYTVKTIFMIKDTPLPVIPLEFEKRARPEWLGNRIGYSDRPPYPWTDLTVKDKSFSCWAKTFTYGRGVLPSQISILGKDILAAPISVTATMGDKTLAETQTSTAVQSATASRVDFNCVARLGDLTLESSSGLEFDGFLWVKLKLSAARPQKVDKLILEIPLKREFATHWYSGQGTVESESGYAPETEYIAAPRSFVRIGGSEQGLQWCWQSLKGWRLGEPRKAMRFIPGKEDYRVEFTLVDHPVDLTQPVEIEFGLHALPSRPFPTRDLLANWWWYTGASPEQNAWPSIGNRNRVGGGSYQGIWNGKWNYLNLADAFVDELKKHSLPRWTAIRHQPGFYLTHLTFDANTPEYKYFQSEWRVAPSVRIDFGSFATDPAKQVPTSVCHHSRSYQDFYLYYLDRFARRMHDPEKMPISFYFDVSYPSVCANAYHGCGYLDENGKRQPETQILALREACKRIYTVVKSLGHDNWVVTHTSGMPYMACWSFSDVSMPGEQWSAFMPMKKAQYKAEGKTWPLDYSLTLPLVRYRAEFSPFAYGPQTLFYSSSYDWIKKGDIPELDAPSSLAQRKGKTKDIWRGWRHFNALHMVHGAAPSLPDLNPMLNEFGWDNDMECLPYWRNQELITMDIYHPDRVVATLFKRPDKLMVFAFNNTDEDVTAKIQLHLQPLGFPGMIDGSLLDVEDQEKIRLVGETAVVPLRKRDFRMLVLTGP